MSARWTPRRLRTQQIRNARHAYYGAISYVDDNLGRLMEALRATGLASNTIVVFLSDHGEMLGERGLWFKMNFFEGGARVPLVISAPRALCAAPRRGERFAGRSFCRRSSILRAAIRPRLAGSIDGRSLRGHLEGAGGHDEVIGEYLAEGAIAPMVMIRRGAMEIHPFAARSRPALRSRRATRRARQSRSVARACAERVAEFRAEVARRWNLAALDAQVRESQRRRRIVDAALTKGEAHSWDFQPYRDASRTYVRNTIPLDDLEAMARFPPVAAPK